MTALDNISFSFQWPWLLILLPLPILVRLFIPAAAHKQSSLRVPFFSRVKQLQHIATSQRSTKPLHLTLLTLLWVCLVIAASRPTWQGESTGVPMSGRDLLLAVDISGSMQITDMIVDKRRTTRLSLVKKVVSDFVAQRNGDRLGLILFGTKAYLQAPLTFDRNTVGTFLNEAQIGFAGEETAIGDAIGLSIKRLESRPENARIIILLTDGENTAGELDPIKAAEFARSENIKIYTIGIGADRMEQRDLFFGKRVVNPSRGLDEATLKTIAQRTGGQYFRAKSAEDLSNIYVELDKLEPIEQDALTIRPIKSLFHWPLGTALLFSVLLALLHIDFKAIFTPTNSAQRIGAKHD